MDSETLRTKYTALAPVLTERSRRLWAATEARALGHGGIERVKQATGLARSTIERGMRELASGDVLSPERTRRPGGGRKRASDKDVTLTADLDALVEPTASGDPDSPLRWTSKSVRRLADELRALGHEVSHNLVAELLHGSGYSLQANRKTREGPQHPDRDAQFRYILEQVRRFQKRGQPAVSVDTKKKELVGDFKNAGREWRPKGTPEPVRVHDFLIPEQGKAIPYGVYDLNRNEGWVSVGIDHDTASLAVNAIRSWWQRMGRPAYAGATSLLITADAGGSNGSRLRLWKWGAANRDGTARPISAQPGAPVRAPDGATHRRGAGVPRYHRAQCGEERIAKLSRLYAVLSQVNEAIVHARDVETLYAEVCRVVGGDRRVSAGLDRRGSRATGGSRGTCRSGGDYLESIQIEIDGPLGAGPGGTCIREDRTAINDDFSVNPYTAP